jgi:RNA polymerase sigma-54 factor
MQNLSLSALERVWHRVKRMAISARLMMRQGQSLVMTPQLLQAIKLLQLSNVELSAFIEEELERNPLLERADDQPDIEAPPMRDDAGDGDASFEGSSDYSGDDFSHDYSSSSDYNDAPDMSDRQDGDWAREGFATNAGDLASSLGTEVENAFDGDRSAPPAEMGEAFGAEGLSATSWNGAPGSNDDGEGYNLESYVAAKPSLRDHLSEQLALAVNDPTDRLIGHAIIDSIEETGYLSASVEEIADRLSASEERVGKVLKVVQTFDPSGVAARDLAECLSIQLRELDRFDPAMQALIANLPLLAKREFPTLRKLCGVDDEDLADMVAEIRRLDPKPGRSFGGGAIQPVVPDVSVRAASDGSWLVELNTEGLPRILVNQTYAARVSSSASNATDKTYITGCLQSANWLTKSLEQRARTILKVATEIVRQQDAFFAQGVEHLRPLNLKTIADAIGMHESTVSRVTSNKYMATPRGLFELKYFFTASIPASAGGEAHSAEAVRFRIKQLIDAEAPNDVLSDDAIVVKLKEANIDIARRTVAKYRESLRIPSSVERRREKLAMQQKSA